MPLTAPTLAVFALVSIGTFVALPVLAQGFHRRGKGVRYEKSFVIQRAPQLASILTIGLITVSFVELNHLGPSFGSSILLGSQWQIVPEPARSILAWLGVAMLASGLFFMIGGWYSLGECFSTDAEVLEGQTVRRTGLLRYVMHPAYSGIIQSLLGASIACTSALSLILTLFVVAPLWLNRAKYEERLLVETFGQSYEAYARELKWRRLVPAFFPIGI